jgi:hypothetical protein
MHVWAEVLQVPVTMILKMGSAILCCVYNYIDRNLTPASWVTGCHNYHLSSLQYDMLYGYYHCHKIL